MMLIMGLAEWFLVIVLLVYFIVKDYYDFNV
jgi:hypothetical protein